MSEPIEFTLLLTREEAWALAEQCKRIGWTEMRALSANDDEAYAMRSAIAKLALALSYHGIEPR